MSMTPHEIRQLLDILITSGWDEALVTVGDVTVAVARNGATLPTAGAAPTVAFTPAPPTSRPEAAAPTPPPPSSSSAAAPASPPAGGVVVGSPSVGTFWRAPEPGAAPFVEVGQRVEAGHELCIVEVMKLMNRVQAPAAGIVTHVHQNNGDAVEFDSPLFTIQPE